jgi:hypothetical protein
MLQRDGSGVAGRPNRRRKVRAPRSIERHSDSKNPKEHASIPTKYADNDVVEAGFLLDKLTDEITNEDTDDVIDRLAEALEPWADRVIGKIRSDHFALARLVAEVMVVQLFHDRGELLLKLSEKPDKH